MDDDFFVLEGLEKFQWNIKPYDVETLKLNIETLDRGISVLFDMMD